MSNGPKAFFNQTDLKHVQTTRYLGQKTFRLESSRSVYTASKDDIEFVIEFPCLLGHVLYINKRQYFILNKKLKNVKICKIKH